MAWIHHWLISNNKVGNKHTQRASSVALSLTLVLSFPGLRTVKTKAYEYAFIYMSVPTARYFRQKFRREDSTNINENNQKKKKMIEIKHL